jgi:predicted dinucleotide-binding enzyme
VRVGSRTPEKLQDFSASSGIPAGNFAEVAQWADLAVLAVRGAIAVDAVRAAGPEHLDGKIVIDTTNPISETPPVDGVLQFFTGPNTSQMEQLQTAFPAVRFVKAFNSVGSARMVNPAFSRGRATMFYCGNDETAKGEVADPGLRTDVISHSDALMLPIVRRMFQPGCGPP